jgi:spermidine/putrescine-binding protein
MNGEMNDSGASIRCRQSVQGSSLELDRRRFLLATAASSLCTYLGFDVSKALAATRSLEVLAWEGCTGEVELATWRQTNDVTVNATIIGTQDDVTAKLVGSNPVQVDVAPYAQGYESILRKLDLLTELDMSKIPNYSKDNTFPFFYQGDRWFWDGKQWGIPWMWGFNTVVYNSKNVAKPKAYKDLLAPSLKGKLTFIDDTATWPVIAKVSGYGDKFPNLTRAEFEDAFEKLEPYRDQCKVFATTAGDATSLLISGEVDAVFCIGNYITGDVRKAGVPCDYAIPEEGAMVWCDALFIPKTAKDRDLAHQFINEMLSPEVQAKLSKSILCGTVNPHAVSLVDPKLRDMWEYDNIDAFMQRSKLYGQPPLESQEYVTYAEWLNKWAEFKGSF